MFSPNSHSEMMINTFGSNLLDKISTKFSSTNKREIDVECESKFRKIIKQSWDSAINSSIAYLAENNSKENLGFIILEGLRSLPNIKKSTKWNDANYWLSGLYNERITSWAWQT